MKIQLIFVSFLIILTSCTSLIINKPTYNNGRYNFSTNRNNLLYAQDSIVIYGFIKTIGTKEPLKFSLITFGCSKVTSDTLGFFRFKDHSISVKSFLFANSIGFRGVETDHLMLSKGDSVNINFYLSEDDRPLINCQ